MPEVTDSRSQASCGHKIEHAWEFAEDQRSLITYKGYDREGDRCAVFACVCPECKDWYENEGLVLHNEEEEDAWFRQIDKEDKDE